MNEPISLFAFFGRIRKGAIAKFSSDAVPNKPAKQYGPAMTGLTAIAKLAGQWVDRAETLMEITRSLTSLFPRTNGSRSTSRIKLSRPPIS
jgi:hypothetical protein